MIQPGTKLAHYGIVSAVGKGGMGEVYRAQDTKLGREVAIKVLPAEFAQDAERLARLEREARMLAALNHPNIAAIHGLEESGETRFLVLELVEGDTLADRLRRGAIPVEESLKLALQIAEALEAAHDKGVVLGISFSESTLTLTTSRVPSSVRRPGQVRPSGFHLVVVHCEFSPGWKSVYRDLPF